MKHTQFVILFLHLLSVVLMAEFTIYLRIEIKSWV